MKRIKLLNGYVDYPDRWMAVKNEDPSECTNCGVLSTRNGMKYGIPTFLFFLKNKTVNEMTGEDEEKVFEACKKVFPHFSLVLNSQVDPKQDSNGKLLNANEWNKAPTIGWFHVFDADEDQDMFTDALIYRETNNW